MENKYPVFGTICRSPNLEIEVFKLIKTADDLPDLNTLKLRHRFNSQRLYQCFRYECTEDEFEWLKRRLNEDNEAFAEWLESQNLEYIKI